MKLNTSSIISMLAGVTGLLLASTAANAAVTWNEIQFSGFLSQGYIQSSGNDYLGTDSTGGDFNLREYAVNANRRFGSQWRVGAQVFGQSIGRYGEDKPTLDWAIVDYNVRQEFGLRAGRVKMPQGLYNEALDLDIARVPVLLPQSIYDARLRDFNASFDGGMAYGNVGLGKAGSVDYKLYYGKKPMKDDAGVSDYFADGQAALARDLRVDGVYGGQIMWTAPEIALRIGYSLRRLDNLQATQPLDIVFPGAEVYVSIPGGADTHILSTEYVTGPWTLAAEIARTTTVAHSVSNFGLPEMISRSTSNYYYLSAARQINQRVSVGAYMSVAKREGDYPPEGKYQKDYALSVRYDPMDHLVLKLEGHLVHGTALVSNNPIAPQPYDTRDNTWNYFAAKATFFF